jgi:hypothetical protein
MKYRLPRKGDRVRFWELGADGLRRQRVAVVHRRRGRWIELETSARLPVYEITQTREMEILPKEETNV